MKQILYKFTPCGANTQKAIYMMVYDPQFDGDEKFANLTSGWIDYSEDISSLGFCDSIEEGLEERTIKGRYFRATFPNQDHYETVGTILVFPGGISKKGTFTDGLENAITLRTYGGYAGVTANYRKEPVYLSWTIEEMVQYGQLSTKLIGNSTDDALAYVNLKVHYGHPRAGQTSTKEINYGLKQYNELRETWRSIGSQELGDTTIIDGILALDLLIHLPDARCDDIPF